eukprot:scpid99556/ scgid11366/ 
MYMYFSSIAIWKRQECISHVHCVLAHCVAPQTGRAVAVRASDCSAWSPAGKLLEMLKVIVRSANVDPDGVTFIFATRLLDTRLKFEESAGLDPVSLCIVRVKFCPEFPTPCSHLDRWRFVCIFVMRHHEIVES